MLKIVAAASVCLLGACAAVPEPQPDQTALRCFPRDQLIGTLTSDYGERLTGIGIDNAGRMAELWVGPEGSFTLLLTPTSAVSCPLTAGEDWQMIAAPRAGQGS